MRKKLRVAANNAVQEQGSDSRLQSNLDENGGTGKGDSKALGIEEAANGPLQSNGDGKPERQAVSESATSISRKPTEPETRTSTTQLQPPGTDTTQQSTIANRTTIQNSQNPPVASSTNATVTNLQQDSGLKSEQESIIKHGRSNSNGSGTQDNDLYSLKRVPTDVSVKSDGPRTPTLSKKTVEAASRQEEVAKLGPPVPPTSQQVPPAVARPSSSVSRATTLSSFDPLGPSSSPTLASDVVPVISFPTNVSLGAVPIGSTAQVFQNASGQTYAAPTTANQMNSAAFVSENPYVVPIALGMAPQQLGSMIPGSQQNAVNGVQMQQPIMLQQPIMFQQVHHTGVQQWSTAQPPPGPNSQPQSAAVHPSNPFDPLS